MIYSNVSGAFIGRLIKTNWRLYCRNAQKRFSNLNTGDHEERDNLKKFLGAVASCSDRLSVEERDMSNILRSPVSFSLEAEGDVTGISFSGIPSGHEFNSLILAIVWQWLVLL